MCLNVRCRKFSYPKHGNKNIFIVIIIIYFSPSFHLISIILVDKYDKKITLINIIPDSKINFQKTFISKISNITKSLDPISHVRHGDFVYFVKMSYFQICTITRGYKS